MHFLLIIACLLDSKFKPTNLSMLHLTLSIRCGKSITVTPDTWVVQRAPKRRKWDESKE